MILCRLLATLYTFIHHRVFAYRLRHSRRFPNLIISIGNLSAGGTGKTPLTIALAEELRNEGKSVLVCLRGYGGRNRAGILVADESGIRADAESAGDEAILIGRRLLQSGSGPKGSIAAFTVVAGPNRADLIGRFGKGCDVVLLDDAFQNPSVHRDLNVVLIDSSVSPEQMKLLPCGRFREGLDALGRADALLLTRSDQAPGLSDRWEALVGAQWPDLPIRKTGLCTVGLNLLVPSRSNPTAIVPARRQKALREHEPGVKGSSLAPHAGDRIVAFCGIGNPESFFRSLETEDYICAERHAFADHHFFAHGELAACGASGLPVITTEKDAARLSSNLDLESLFPGGLFSLRTDFILLGGPRRTGDSILSFLKGSRGRERQKDPRKGFTSRSHHGKRKDRR